MRTAAQETAPQIALRNRSKEAGEKERICVILVKGEYLQSKTLFCCCCCFFAESFCWSREASATVTRKDFSAFQDRRRYKNWLIKPAPENI